MSHSLLFHSAPGRDEKTNHKGVDTTVRSSVEQRNMQRQGAASLPLKKNLYSRVSFNTTCDLQVGESLCVTGDCSELGDWAESSAVELVTTPEYFPTWYLVDPIPLPIGRPVKYKYFIKSGGQFARWESVEGDRCFTPMRRDFVVDDIVDTSQQSAAPPTAAAIKAREARNEASAAAAVRVRVQDLNLVPT